MAKLEEVVRVCRREGLYTVINLHPPGWGDRIEEFWGSEPRQEAYVTAWKEVARRHAASGDGVAYDLMNEPNGKRAPAAWNRLAKRLTKAIREIDPRHVIVVEPPGWGLPAGFADLEPTGDPNTVYSFHREWYAMDLEREPEDRAREGRRSETEAVKVFKRHLAR